MDAMDAVATVIRNASVVSSGCRVGESVLAVELPAGRTAQLV
jgi:hypothetical protein